VVTETEPNGADVCDPPDPATGGADNPHASRDRSSVGEIVVGAVLMAAVAVVGIYLSYRPNGNPVDRWVFHLVPDSRNGLVTGITRFRYPAVIVAGSVVLGLVTVRRDWTRALACAAGPPLALLVGELVVKPAVGRTLGSSFSYPSGSTVGAAALAMALVLAASPRWRVLAVAVAAAYALWMTVAVLALRWHFPTDVMAGLALGVGLVLVVDGGVWWAARGLGMADRRPLRGRVGTARGGPPAHPAS